MAQGGDMLSERFSEEYVGGRHESSVSRYGLESLKCKLDL